MLRFYVLAAAVVATMFARATAPKSKDEAGIGTLEMVVIGLGLLLLATAAIAVFKGAVDSRLQNIK